MPELEFLLPGDPEARTGGTLYDRQVISGLSALGWRVRRRRLPEGFPFPDRGALEAAEEVLAAAPDDALVVVDGLALGAMPAQAAAQAERLRLVALVHHPLALETGLAPDAARRLYESERRALATVRRVLVTSESTAAALGDYGVPRTRIGVIEPGVTPRTRARGSRDGALSLLCVAAVVPRKGHDILVQALHGLRQLPWRLTCVGSLQRSPETVAKLRLQLSTLGLEDRIGLVDEVDEAELIEHFDRADIFVLPTHYEGYGMALAEALAHGLPVISTRTGAVPRTVPPEAGLLVSPGDGEALARALERVMREPELRRRLADAAFAAGRRLPTWQEVAARFAAELRGVSSP